MELLSTYKPLSQQNLNSQQQEKQQERSVVFTEPFSLCGAAKKAGGGMLRH